VRRQTETLVGRRERHRLGVHPRRKRDGATRHRVRERVREQTTERLPPDVPHNREP
jgi:hypothetical protein